VSGQSVHQRTFEEEMSIPRKALARHFSSEIDVCYFESIIAKMKASSDGAIKFSVSDVAVVEKAF
jgi:hypothetical protein